MVELIPPLCGDFEAPGAALFWLYCCQITDSSYVRFYNQISSDNTAVPLISVFLISGTCVILGFQLIKFVFPLEEAAVHPEPAYVYSASLRRWMPGRKCQAQVNQPNPHWLLSAVHHHVGIRPDISVDDSAGAQVPKEGGLLQNNWSYLWNRKTFTSVLRILSRGFIQLKAKADLRRITFTGSATKPWSCLRVAISSVSRG